MSKTCIKALVYLLALLCSQAQSGMHAPRMTYAALEHPQDQYSSLFTCLFDFLEVADKLMIQNLSDV